MSEYFPAVILITQREQTRNIQQVNLIDSQKCLNESINQDFSEGTEVILLVF